MAIPSHPVVKPDNVFALTKKGEAELKGSHTSLDDAALELLVRIDGKTPVVKVVAGMSGRPAKDVLALISRLLGSGYIDSAKRDENVIEFDATGGIAALSADALSNATQEAGTGITSLERMGYYVRIARTPAERVMLPLDRKPVAVVVEDEPSVAEFLKHLVRFENFEVRTAATRDEVVQAFRQPPRPDLVLLDVMLPDADGFDILAKIRQHPALSTVPVIMLTAKATREAVIRGLAGGANGYITKPFEPHILVQAIKTLFGIDDGSGSKDRWQGAR